MIPTTARARMLPPATRFRQVRWWYPLLVAGAVAIAVFLPPAVGVGLAAGVVGGVLVLRRPVWGVYALVLSIPVQREILLRGQTSTQVVMAGLLFAWWAWMAVGRRAVRVPPFALTLAAYITVMALSLVVATSVSSGLAEMARWAVVLFSYLIIVNTVRTRAEVLGLVACFFAGATAEALLGLWQVVTRQVPDSFFVGQGADPSALAPRAFGTIGMPNSYAGYLNLTLPLALALSLYLLARYGRPLLTRWRAGDRRTGSALRPVAGTLAVAGLAVLMVAGLVLSYSRGGLLGLALGVLAMAAVLGRRAAPALTVLFLAAALVTGFALAGVLPRAINDRLTSTVSQLEIYDVRGIEPTPENFNQVERLAHWQAAGAMFLYDPWLGVGIGNYNLVFPRFTVERWPISRGQAHNYYLQALAETGLLGLLAYLVVLGTAVASGWRAIRWALRGGQPLAATLLIGAFGVVLAVAGHSVFEDLHVLNLGIHWAAVIALFYLVPRYFVAPPAGPPRPGRPLREVAP